MCFLCSKYKLQMDEMDVGEHIHNKSTCSFPGQNTQHSKVHPSFCRIISSQLNLAFQVHYYSVLVCTHQVNNKTLLLFLQETLGCSKNKQDWLTPVLR